MTTMGLPVLMLRLFQVLGVRPIIAQMKFPAKIEQQPLPRRILLREHGRTEDGYKNEDRPTE